MDLHRGAAGVGEYVGDSFPLEGFDEDVGALSGFVGGKSGNESVQLEDGGGVGIRVREDIGDVERAAAAAVVVEEEGGFRGNGKGRYGKGYFGFGLMREMRREIG